MPIATTRGRHPLSPDDWTTEKYDAFARELNVIHADVKANLGSEDVA